MYGQDASLSINFQDSYGVMNTTSFHYVEFISETLTNKKDQLVKQGMRGILDENDSVEGMNYIEGELNVEVNPYILPVMLNTVMDYSVSSSGGLTLFTFNPAQSDFDTDAAHKPFSTIVEMPTETPSSLTDQYLDCMASNLELSYAGGDFVKAKVSILGRAINEVALTTYSPTFPEANNLLWNATSISLDGAGVCKIDELTVTIDQPLDRKYSLCYSPAAMLTHSPTRIKRSGKRTINISGTITFESRTTKDLFNAQTDFPLIINLLDSSSVGLTLDFPKCKFTEFPVTVEGPDELTVSFQAKAQYHTGSGTALTATAISSLQGV